MAKAKTDKKATTRKLAEYIRAKGRATAMDGLEEYVMTFELNRSLSLNDIVDLLNNNKRMKGRIKLQDGMGHVIVNSKIANEIFVSHDMDRTLYLSDGQEIRMGYNQPINIHVNKHGAMDIILHIDVPDNYDLLVHFYLNTEL